MRRLDGTIGATSTISTTSAVGCLRHQALTHQVRPENEGPRARYPRPDALSITLGLALRERSIRTGDGAGQDTDDHLPSPPPETR